MSIKEILSKYSEDQILEWVEENIEDQCGLEKNGTGACWVSVGHDGYRLEVFTPPNDDNEDMANDLIEHMSKKGDEDLIYVLETCGPRYCCLWLEIDS